jgi:hypothetical protein
MPIDDQEPPGEDVWWRTFDAWLDAEVSRNTTTQMDHALIGPRPVKLVNVKRNRLAVSGITTTRFIPNAVVRILRVQGGGRRAERSLCQTATFNAREAVTAA